MNDPTDTGEFFEVEVTDLPPPRSAGQPGEIMAIHPLLQSRLSLRARAFRLATIILCVLLVTPVFSPDVRALVTAAISPGWPSVSQMVGHLVSLPERDTGAWAVLDRRPLHLEVLPSKWAPCPSAPGGRFTSGMGAGLGSGPTYAVASGSMEGELRYPLAHEEPNAFGITVLGPGQQKVLWFISPDYQGPVLIRGRRLNGGPYFVHFTGGLDQEQDAADLANAPRLTELPLMGDASYGSPWPGWLSYTFVPAPGCYAYQVDGLSFSEVIVFQAVPAS